jgi:hypothetical protein
MNFRDYHAETNERCDKLSTQQQKDAVRKAVLSAALAARAADELYFDATKDRKLNSQSTDKQDKRYDAKYEELCANAERARLHFDNLLDTVIMVATSSVAADQAPCPAATLEVVAHSLVPQQSSGEWTHSDSISVGDQSYVEIPHPSAPTVGSVMHWIDGNVSVSSGAPGAYGSMRGGSMRGGSMHGGSMRGGGGASFKFSPRDLVQVSLDMTCIGKVTARGPILTVCELEEGCWAFNRYSSKIKLIPAGTQILAIYDSNNAASTPLLICPYDKTHNCIGYITDNIEDREHIVGKVGMQKFKSIGGFGPSFAIPSYVSALSAAAASTAAGSPPIITPGFLAYMAANFWKRDNKYDSWEIGLPQNLSTIDGGETKYKNQAAFSQYSTTRPYTPKFRTIRCENSYRVLVAAPWEFDSIKSRIASGERVDLLAEFEKVLLGTECPTFIYGRGVEFEYVLESQIEIINHLSEEWKIHHM